jgi:uncharacterized repeat protein (TIGR03837 family)
VGARFGTQDEYDRLLWACDFNFVRGEDSFVRAQWGARPLAWQAYPQAGDAQLPKVDAWLDRYTAGLDPRAARAMRGLTQAWNRGDGPAAVTAWRVLRTADVALQTHAARWCERLAALPDLASNLLDFCRNRL